MVASVWYPVNYFRLSFGKQDRLSQIVLKIKSEDNLANDAKKREVVNAILTHISTSSEIASEIMSLGRFVPYRFMRPFFKRELQGKPDWKIDSLVVDLAEKSFNHPENLCLYRFVSHPENGIEIQKDWFEYLQKHLHILIGFCLWHLLEYLQKNNPNVPNIPRKIFEPKQRELKQARIFWDIALDELGLVQCIYSNQAIQKYQISLDHFLPWSFVAHDFLWNIIPTEKGVNSAKGDNLPDIKLYFDPFSKLQYNAFQAVFNPKKVKNFEDYTLLFKKDEVTEIKSLSFAEFRETLYNTVIPQIQIAKNMGFTANWRYFKPLI